MCARACVAAREKERETSRQIERERERETIAITHVQNTVRCVVARAEYFFLLV